MKFREFYRKYLNEKIDASSDEIIDAVMGNKVGKIYDFYHIMMTGDSFKELTTANVYKRLRKLGLSDAEIGRVREKFVKIAKMIVDRLDKKHKKVLDKSDDYDSLFFKDPDSFLVYRLYRDAQRENILGMKFGLEDKKEIEKEVAEIARKINYKPLEDY